MRYSAQLGLGASVAGTFVGFHALLFAVAVMVYSSIDFHKQFVVPADTKVTFGTILYFTITVSATFSTPNDLVPRTQFGRSLVAIHAVTSWMQSVVVLFLSRTLRKVVL